MGGEEIHKMLTVEILDSTLRDGEQTNGVSFLPHEKLSIARLLLKDVKVNRLEVASARVSEGEKEAVTMICRYAQQLSSAPVEDGGRPDALDSIEVLGFVDNGKSIQWITDCGCKVINMLTKGSENHCIHQLSKTKTIAYTSFQRLPMNTSPTSRPMWQWRRRLASASISILRTGATACVTTLTMSIT